MTDRPDLDETLAHLRLALIAGARACEAARFVSRETAPREYATRAGHHANQVLAWMANHRPEALLDLVVLAVQNAWEDE